MRNGTFCSVSFRHLEAVALDDPVGGVASGTDREA
jgi:hypothetical protein